MHPIPPLWNLSSRTAATLTTGPSSGRKAQRRRPWESNTLPGLSMGDGSAEGLRRGLQEEHPYAYLAEVISQKGHHKKKKKKNPLRSQPLIQAESSQT